MRIFGLRVFVDRLRTQVFKSFMYAYLPDWEEREQQLRSYSLALAAGAGVEG